MQTIRPGAVATGKIALKKAELEFVWCFIRLINKWKKMSTTKVVEKTKSEDLTSHTLSFLLSSHIKVNQDILDSLVGRDELTISEAPNDENIIGSLVIDVQKSTIRGQNCLYVHQVWLLF